MAYLRLITFYTKILLFYCMYITAHSITHSISIDKEALLSLKSHFTVQSPNLLSTWNLSSSPCNWTGVTCSKYDQSVVGLDLSGLGLTGTISPYIGNLSSLRSLHLQNNQLRGAIPDQIGNLFNLRDLNMSSNTIEGVLPRDITKCKELMILDLMQNEISGTIPGEIGLLTKLQVLRLGRNHLSGSIPSSISNISSLQKLNLGTNTIGGPIPVSLQHLRHLKYLDLTINNLTGTVPPSIYNMTSLVYLAVAGNNLWGDLPYNVGETLPNLRGFNFCFNKFTGTIPGSLHNLTNMQIIRMAQNFLHGSIPPGLGNLPELQMYNIGYNSIVSSGRFGLDFLKLLANSTKLNFLVFEYNLLEGEIPESIGNLSQALHFLYMGGNKYYGTIPPSIGSLSSLGLLDMSNSSISGEIPEELGQLKELQVLNLHGNRLSGTPPDSLGNLQKLLKIDLSGNELFGSIPSTFKNLQKLQSMDLSNNRLNGSIPKEILNLQSLSSFLNLSHNDLTGPLPKEIGLLKGVQTIHISDNQLSGNIPEEIGDCESLERLILANNKFSGKIPDSLGRVNGLATLDLSSNELSGELPMSLGMLHALKHLNLSFNNLEGKVPTFSSSQEVDLEGNPKLCIDSGCKGNTPNRSRKWLVVGISITVVIALTVSGILLQSYDRARDGDMKSDVTAIGQEHQMITYDELRHATNNFSQKNVIGKGSFGSVYLGMLAEGTAVAVKVLDLKTTGSGKSFLAECTAAKNVRHRNLVKLITTCSSLDNRNMEFLGLVYEFMSNGSLEDWLTGRKTANGKGLNLLDRLKVIMDVACALVYLHNDCETPIVHCDIKPGNVLMDTDMTAKVGDFGLARLLIERIGKEAYISSTHALKGSIGYIPPEYGLGQKPSTAGDVYSFGIMLLEVLTGRSPTHESFGGLGIKNWVQEAFPANIEQVLDSMLLLPIHDDNSGDKKIGSHNSGALHDCLISVISIGLSCVADSPDERISMKDALNSLNNAKSAIVKTYA